MGWNLDCVSTSHVALLFVTPGRLIQTGVAEIFPSYLDITLPKLAGGNLDFELRQKIRGPMCRTYCISLLGTMDFAKCRIEFVPSMFGDGLLMEMFLGVLNIFLQMPQIPTYLGSRGVLLFHLEFVSKIF